ncbi:M1 family metallopeptidase [Hymenobacter sp. BT186]|uniref:Aminopeptidase N n=1 Tax=Hymenobacter telluris TaxID=2816474 RepID=A0A939ETA9_9BACT|nr:M1 family metallopeptidase [Hymenobacter telluris]MBO0357135.1 M1 family metallopeptidase [Hymenobacter telluris]MBW3373162.1 M1 family metallopeptidase [Hymenobacter norwichensis]
MKYSLLGVLGLVLVCQLEATAQTVKSGKSTTSKAATHKKTSAGSEPVSTSPAPATIVVPSWLPPTNPVQPAATIVHDLLDTKLDVRFDWGRQWLLGTATLTLRPHFYPQNQLVLDAKGFEVKTVRLVTGTKEKNLNFAYDKKKLTVTLDRQYSRTEPYQVRIQYTAKPNELEAGGSAAITGDKGLYFINPLGTDKTKPRQVWTQGETEGSSCWFPTIDKPNQRMTQEISLTVEANLKTLSNGLLIASKKNNDGTRTDTWKQSLPHAPYLAMLAAGDFAVVSDSWRGKAVDYYVDPQFAGTAKAVFGNTPEMLTFFSQKLGVDFPWEKYSQVAVHDFVSGAMENTTAVTFEQSIVQFTARELPDVGYDPESTVAHELFHHWFGDYVTTESWANLPLNESFADYSELLWAEYKYGADAAALVQQEKMNRYLEEAQSKREPLIRYQYAQNEDMFDRHSYDKGGRVLHMLRKYVGDDAFFTALNRYLTQNKLSSTEVAKLRIAFEETTGEDLMWFFDQWFLHRGHPELKVTHSYIGNQVNLHVQQLQDSTFTPIYRLPVTVTTWVNNQPTDHRIVVTKADQTFRLMVNQRPSLVKFDSEAQLLAQIEEERSQDELLYQFSHARNYLQKYEAIDLLRTKNSDLAVSAMLRNALDDKFWAVRQAAVQALRRYKGAEGNAVRRELQRVAASDKNNQVRATAIATLSAFNNEDYGSIYTAALSDSSYRIVSAAIQALAKAPTPDSRDRINALQATKSHEVLNALSAYYSLNGNSIEQYQWFLRRLPDVSEVDLYQSYLPNFATFMLRIPVVERDKGVQKLESLARTSPRNYVRLGAYRGLNILAPSMPMLKATMQDIRNKEKDEQVKAYYALMQ